MIRFDLRKFFHANERRLRKDWSRIKRNVGKEIEGANFERSIRLLEQASSLAYTYNFVADYWDFEIESFLQQISTSLVGDRLDSLDSPKGNGVLFFDHFVLENRGFAQQYLDAFMESGVEVLYLIDDPKNYTRQNRIIETVSRYSKGTIKILTATSRVGKFHQLLEIIAEYQPCRAFFHTAPWEVLSCCAAFALKVKTSVKCYLLNITDHAFWPGITCFEFIIDWRSLGAHINTTLKGKEKENVILIPTPSYFDRSIGFEGFPEIPDGKIIGFSGGSFYKILDRNNTFLNLIKDVIEHNKDFVFIFAAVGGLNKIEEFVNEHKLQNRFFVVGNRRDIGQIFQRIDIYFNTYPFSGGLMMKYAIEFDKPILSFANNTLVNSRLDMVLDCELSGDHLIFDKNHYLIVASKLINDAVYRKAYTVYYESLRMINSTFQINIQRLLNDDSVEAYCDCRFEISQKEITAFHIESERIQGSFYEPRIYEIFRYKPMTQRLWSLLRYLVFKVYKKLFCSSDV